MAITMSGGSLDIAENAFQIGGANRQEEACSSQGAVNLK